MAQSFSTALDSVFGLGESSELAESVEKKLVSKFRFSLILWVFAAFLADRAQEAGCLEPKRRAPGPRGSIEGYGREIKHQKKKCYHI